MSNNAINAEELNRLKAALQNAPAVTFAQDGLLRYRSIQPPFPGLEEEQILGKMDADFLPEAEAQCILETKRSVLKEHKPRHVVVLMTTAGQERVYLLVLQPEPEGEGLTGTALDITEMTRPAAGDNTGEARARLLFSLSRSFVEYGSDYQAVLNVITRMVAQTAGDGAAIWDWRSAWRDDEEIAFLSLAAIAQTPSTEAAFREQIAGSLKDADGELITELKQLQAPIQVTDLMSHEDWLAHFPASFREWLGEFPVHGVLILPLRTPRGMLGILCTWCLQAGQPCTPDDLVFWQDVADQAALAMENARLYAEEVNRNRQLNALHDATTALLATLNLEVLLGRILDAAQQAIPAAERGVLYLVAPRTGQLEVRATAGFNDPRIRRTSLLHNHHANRAMRERRPLLLHDTRNESAGGTVDGARASDLEAARSAIIAPLVLGNEVLGALSLSSSLPAAFNQSDLQLAASFAATTTVALHNATLHTELQKIAITDPLTGLYNRRGLLELGRHEIERFHRFGQPLSAIMLDIDHFKRVNDTYGHPIGDQVLCELAERCRAIIRQVDILSRYGGEEFAILLPETDLFQASTVAERLRQKVEEQPFYTEQGPIAITVSLGVSRAGRNLSSLVQLIEQVDAALYRAKQNGRNRVELG